MAVAAVIIAGLSLAVSAAVAGYTWHRDRAALLEVRFERYDVRRFEMAGGLGGTNESYRLIVENHGPAIARNLTITVTDGSGADATNQLRAYWPPILALHPRQELHLAWQMEEAVAEQDPADRYPRAADIAWRDRRGRRTENYTLSLRDLA